jgi:SAM-dependent methyltransferase
MTDPLPPFMATDPDVYEQFMGRCAKPFLEFAGIRPSDRVLDIGCGTGTLSLALQHAAKAVGMDASEPYLGGARLRRSHLDITYDHGDACHLRHAIGSFDACISTLAIDMIFGVGQTDHVQGLDAPLIWHLGCPRNHRETRRCSPAAAASRSQR